VEATKPVSERLAAEVDSLSVDPSYSGPHLPPLPQPGTPPPTAEELASDPDRVNAHGISLAFVRALMAEYKAQRGLPRKYSLQLLLRLNALLRSLPSLVRVPFPSGAPRFNVCGDTHGQYYDTLHVFGACGLAGGVGGVLRRGQSGTVRRPCCCFLHRVSPTTRSTACSDSPLLWCARRARGRTFSLQPLPL
jgi:hypothetical protein